jgi:hypothetical protein
VSKRELLTVAINPHLLKKNHLCSPSAFHLDVWNGGYTFASWLALWAALYFGSGTSPIPDTIT